MRWARLPRSFRKLKRTRISNMRLRLMRVEGHSMRPVFSSGDLVVIKEAAASYVPRLGEIVAARPVALRGRAVIKRVGDHIGTSYRLLGDDQHDSLDSRSFGLVAPHEIIGPVWIRLWPFRIKMVDERKG